MRTKPSILIETVNGFENETKPADFESETTQPFIAWENRRIFLCYQSNSNQQLCKTEMNEEKSF